jgi:2-phosphoglycerate kinase
MLPVALERAVLVQCVLNIDDPSLHAEHFVVRDVASDGTRSLDKYLSSFDEIREIQELIVGRARDVGVAVIENESMERAVAELMDLVFTEVEKVQVDEAD